MGNVLSGTQSICHGELFPLMSIAQMSFSNLLSSNSHPTLSQQYHPLSHSIFFI